MKRMQDTIITNTEVRDERKPREVRPCTPTKRKVTLAEKEKTRSPKRRRPNQDIKKYISCKKWREEEEQGQGRDQGQGSARKGEDPRHELQGEGGAGRRQQHHHLQDHHEVHLPSLGESALI